FADTLKQWNGGVVTPRSGFPWQDAYLTVHVILGIGRAIESSNLAFHRRFCVGQFDGDQLPFATTDTGDAFLVK
ncbi:MAG: hypothetical protein SGJ03_10045, partial [Alphaproteobacteria bacterium]|nr:hypothetical protein [Alphaproteobacteria bacterium]